MPTHTSSGLSRRRVILGAAAAPLIGVARTDRLSPASPTPRADAEDPVLQLARYSLALHRENNQLHRRYGDLEAWLADNFDWFKLTEAQQRALPEGRGLFEIDDRFTVLKRERPRSIRRLRRTAAASLPGVIGKLQVVAIAMQAEDEFTSAQRLLESTIRDLRALQKS